MAAKYIVINGFIDVTDHVVTEDEDFYWGYAAGDDYPREGGPEPTAERVKALMYGFPPINWPRIRCVPGSGGGEGDAAFVAEYTYDDETEALVCDKTLAEICAAVAAGKRVMAKNGENFFPLIGSNLNEDSAKVMFASMSDTWYDEETGTHGSYSFIHHLMDPDDPTKVVIRRGEFTLNE